MARIYKGTETNLKLFIPCNYGYTDLDVVLFTDNPNQSIIITEVERNEDIINVRVKKDDLSILNDGVVKYIITDADGISIERQSNYYLKTPSSYEAENVTTQLLKEVVFVENGEYSVKVDDGYIGMEEVKVNVDLPIEEIRETSYSEGKEIGIQEGYVSGYTQGSSDGYSSGYTVGNTEGYESGHTQGYSEGYIEGTEIGYNTGKSDQKELLETITVNENGTYEREDGYSKVIVDVPDVNGSFEDGYNTAVDEILTNTQTLYINKNGFYGTKLSEPHIPEKTAELPDGTPFYNYAEMDTYCNINTNISLPYDFRFEAYYKITENSKTGIIIGSDGNDLNKAVVNYNKEEEKIEFLYRTYSTAYTLSDIEKNEWLHIVYDKRNGLSVNDNALDNICHKADYIVSSTLTVAINGSSGFYNSNKGAGGKYSIVIVDGVMFIPTKDGYKKYDTDEILGRFNTDKYEYDFFEDNEIYFDGELIKEVTVDIQPKISVAETKIKFGYSNMVQIPEYFDFEGIKDVTYLFTNCYKLETVPLFNTSIITDFSKMFNNCNALKYVPLFDMSSADNLSGMFENCASLTTIPQFNTHKVKNFSRLFYSCSNLKSVPALDASSAERQSYGLFGYSNNTNLTDFGGLINLKASIDSSYGFEKLPNLTYESCINILNGLYDFVGNGITPTSSQGKLKVHSNFLTLVGDEISIGTDKGWTITT